MQILVVDDTAEVRNCLMEFLTEEGFSVYACEDGKEAIRYLDEVRGHVKTIITDFNMPRMNGAELAKIAKDQWPHIQVIIMSAELEQLPADHSADKLVSKPFRLEELLPLL